MLTTVRRRPASRRRFAALLLVLISCGARASLFGSLKLRPGQRPVPSGAKQLDPREERKVSFGDVGEDEADVSEEEKDSWNSMGHRLGDSAGGEHSFNEGTAQERGEVAVLRLREQNEHLRKENKELIKDLKVAQKLNADLCERENAWKEGMLQLETLEATWADGVKKLKEDRDEQEKKMRAEAKRVRKSMEEIVVGLKQDKQKLKAKLKAAEDRVTELVAGERDLLDEQQDLRGSVASQGVEISALGRLEHETISALQELVRRQVGETQAQAASSREAADRYKKAQESVTGDANNEALLAELGERERALVAEAASAEQRLGQLADALQRLLEERDKALEPFPATQQSGSGLTVKNDVEMSELTRKLQLLEGTVVDMDSRLLSSSAQIQALEDELRQARTTVANREESCRRLEHLLEKKEEEVELLRQQLREAEEEGERRVAEVTEGFEKEIGGLQGQVAKLEGDLEGKVSKLHALEATMAEREQKHEERLAQLEAEKGVLAEAAGKGKRRMQELREKLQSAASQATASTLSSELAAAAASVAAIEELIETKSEELESARSSVGKAVQEKQELEAAKAEAEALLLQLQSAPLKEGWLRERMSKASPAQQAWFARALSLREGQEEVEEDEMCRLREERDVLHTKVSELEGAVRHVQQQRQKQEEAGERDRQRALREIEEQETRLAALRSEKAGLQQQLRDLETQFEKGARLGVDAGEEGRLAGELEVARMSLLALQSQNNETQNQLRIKQEELDRTLRRAENERREREKKDLHQLATEQRMQQWRAMLSARANELENALDLLRRQTEEAQAQREAAEGQAAAAEGRAQAVAIEKDGQIAALQEERGALQSQLAQLRAQVTKERKAYGEMVKRVGGEREELEVALHSQREQAATLQGKLRELVAEGQRMQRELEEQRGEQAALEQEEQALAGQLREALHAHLLDQGRVEELLAASEALSSAKRRIAHRNSEVHRQLAVKVAEIEVTNELLAADVDQASAEVHTAEAALLKMEVHGVPAMSHVERLKFEVRNGSKSPGAKAHPQSAASQSVGAWLSFVFGRSKSQSPSRNG